MPAAAAEKEQPATRFAKDQLKAFVERIERLEEEKKATSGDIRDVYAEAKGTGLDTKALRTIVRLRKLNTDERREQQEERHSSGPALMRGAGSPSSGRSSKTGRPRARRICGATSSS